MGHMGKHMGKCFCLQMEETQFGEVAFKEPLKTPTSLRRTSTVRPMDKVRTLKDPYTWLGTVPRLGWDRSIHRHG